MSPEKLLERARRSREEILQIFIDVEHWNRVHPKETPIDPDPDGELRRASNFLERAIVALDHLIWKRNHIKAEHEERALVKSWNRMVKVGDEVEFWNFPNDPPRRARTRSEASMLGGHTAVVWLEGVSGCYALRNCRPIPQERPS